MDFNSIHTFLNCIYNENAFYLWFIVNIFNNFNLSTCLWRAQEKICCTHEKNCVCVFYHISITPINQPCDIMMTSSNGNISALLAVCAGNSPVTGEYPAKKPGTQIFRVSLICSWINDWVNNREAGDLRRHRAHYDVTVMIWHTVITKGSHVDISTLFISTL